MGKRNKGAKYQTVCKGCGGKLTNWEATEPLCGSCAVTKYRPR